MSFTTLVDDLTRVVIGLLLVIATIVVVLGLTHAYRDRRRFELVITNIVGPKEFSASLFSELSEELRGKVHHLLMAPAARHLSIRETVGRDIESQIAAIPGITTTDIGLIEQAIQQGLRHEVLAAPRDALAAVSGGIRALKPQQADGFIQALSAFLPAQRGLLVGSRVVCQLEGDGSRMGISVQVGPLSGEAQAQATFWSGNLLAASTDLTFAEPRWLSELLSLAAEWIIVYLIGAIGIEGAAGQRGRWGRPGTARQRRALLEILTAQWASYAMYSSQAERPDVALDWAQQALEDAYRARKNLPDYYYPLYLIGSINRICGDCCIRLSEQAFPGQSRDGQSYRLQASRHFSEANRALKDAESRLEALARGQASPQCDGTRQSRVQSIRIERLTNSLLMGDGLAGLNAVEEAEIRPFDFESTINVAALHAVAASVADRHGRDSSEHLRRACRYLIEVAGHGRDVEFLRTDKDLNRGLAPADLDWLLDEALTADGQAREGRLVAIAARGTPTARRH